MVKYLEINNCRECPHWQEDPQTMDESLWGKQVCVYFWHLKESEIKLLNPEEDFPEWCPLDGPNDL